MKRVAVYRNDDKPSRLGTSTRVASKLAMLLTALLHDTLLQ